MAIRDSILPEFKQEMATSRKTLERVPEGKPDWAPHPRSMKMNRLAGHITELPGLVSRILTEDAIDFRPAGAPPRVPYEMTTRQSLLEVFDKNVAAAGDAIARASDEELTKPFTLSAAGKVIVSLPRVAVLRSVVLNHVIHHRGQLSVYLRLNDVPVPSIYGPSADEGIF